MVHSVFKQFSGFVELSLDSSLALLVWVVDDSQCFLNRWVLEICLSGAEGLGKAILSFSYTTSQYFAKVLEDYRIQHGVQRKQLM